jgi:hypothetical protein
MRHLPQIYYAGINTSGLLLFAFWANVVLSLVDHPFVMLVLLAFQPIGLVFLICLPVAYRSFAVVRNSLLVPIAVMSILHSLLFTALMLVAANR